MRTAVESIVMSRPRRRVFRALAASIAVALVCAVVGAGVGCRFVPRRGPVPPELADARRLSNEGLSALDRGDRDRAQTLLAQAVSRCPVDVDARRHYADVLWKQGRRTEAVGQVSEALKLSPDDAGLCIMGGWMYLELGLLADTERLAADAVRLAPRSAEAWHLRGRLAMARGEFTAAVDDFHRGLATAPGHPELLTDTAEAYLCLDKPRRALATLAILAENAGPGHMPTPAIMMEAAALEALGRRDEALAGYREAVARGDAPATAAERLAALQESAAATLR
jgi:tetratricopeptide (TPR) repeat protein